MTGLGAVTPIGSDVSTTWESILAGRSGIDRLSRFEHPESEGAIAGEVRDFQFTKRLPAKMVRHTDRSVQYGVAAALEALDDAGLQAETGLGRRAGVVFGSSLRGHVLFESQSAVLRKQGPRRVSPFMLPSILPDAATFYEAGGRLTASCRGAIASSENLPVTTGIGSFA